MISHPSTHTSGVLKFRAAYQKKKKAIVIPIRIQNNFFVFNHITMIRGLCAMKSFFTNEMIFRLQRELHPGPLDQQTNGTRAVD